MCSSVCLANEEQTKQEVLDAFKNLRTAASELDGERYFSLFDQSKFVGLNSDGSNWNNFEEFRALVEPGFGAIEKVNELTFPNVKVTVLDDNNAILINEYQQTMTLKDGTQATVAGGGTQVWSKHSGKWLLVSVSASNKAQPD